MLHDNQTKNRVMKKFMISYFDKNGHKKAYRQTKQGVENFLKRLTLKAYIVSELDSNGVYVLLDNPLK